MNAQELYNASQVADLLEIPDASTVRKIATREKIGRRVGRSWVFTAGDVEKIRAGYQGRSGKPTEYTPEQRAELVAEAERDGFEYVAELRGVPVGTLYQWRHRQSEK